MVREPFARTMNDYAAEYQWILLLGWSDEELEQVQVHEVPDPAEEMLDLADLGGMHLPIGDAELGTSADVHDGVRNLYVYRSTTPPELWQRLQDLVASGGPALPGRAGDGLTRPAASSVAVCGAGADSAMSGRRRPTTSLDRGYVPHGPARQAG